jgi:hypothetical protein
MSNGYHGWKYSIRIEEEDGELIECHIRFYKVIGDWYDEIRYDSHERKGGHRRLQPHLHIKIKSSLQEAADIENRIKKIIDLYVPKLKELAEP